MASLASARARLGSNNCSQTCRFSLPTEFLPRQTDGHLPVSHQAKLAQHLCQQHLTPVDHYLSACARTGGQRRRLCTVNQIDDHCLCAQVLDLERQRAVVAPDRCCIHNDVITCDVEVRQGHE